MAILKTPLDLRLAFEKITRNQHDVDDTYQLLTDSRDGLITDLKPGSPVLDISQTAQANATYLTMYPLPANWSSTTKIVVDIIPYYPIRFEERIGYRFSARHYYIDIKNQQFALTGVVANGPKVINHWYWDFGNPMVAEAETLDIAINNLMGQIPQRFWRLVVWEAAFVFLGGIDGDDVGRIISQQQMAQYYRMRDNFTAWVADTKLQAMNGQLGYAEEDDRPFDVGLL